MLKRHVGGLGYHKGDLQRQVFGFFFLFKVYFNTTNGLFPIIGVILHLIS